jgi:phi13 family phage major tail protein
MTIDSGEYKSRIGLDSLYVAEVTEDTGGETGDYAADTPEYLAPAAEATQSPTQNTETQYADDQPFDTISSEGPTDIVLTVTGIPLVTLAKITGRVYDSVNGLMYDNGGVAPYYALMFRSLKSNGSYRYYAYLKGRFDMPSEDAATKGETPEPKTQQLTFHAIKTIHKWQLASGVEDGVKRIIGDEDADNFDGDDWFDAVPEPLYAGSA